MIDSSSASRPTNTSSDYTSIAERRGGKPLSINTKNYSLPGPFLQRTPGPHAAFLYLPTSPERTPPYHPQTKELIDQARSRGELFAFVPKRPEEHYTEREKQMPPHPPTRIVAVVPTTTPSITQWIRNEIIQKCVTDAL